MCSLDFFLQRNRLKTADAHISEDTRRIRNKFVLRLRHRAFLCEESEYYLFSLESACCAELENHCGPSVL